MSDKQTLAKYAEELAKDSTNDFLSDLVRELGVSLKCASDVWYLRTRARHTQELESELIRLHKEGTPPNIYEFGTPSKQMKEFIEQIDATMKH